VEIVPDGLPKVPKAPRGAVFTVEAPKPAPEKAGREEASEKNAHKSADTDEPPHFGRGA
jgi:hypothetical protein